MFDLRIMNGLIADGRGGEPFSGDVCVEKGRIAYIGSSREIPAARTFDAAGRLVCPGFIDIHSHSDASPFQPYLCDSKLRQGITTELCGNCGSSPLPTPPEQPGSPHRFDSVSEYAGAVNARGNVINTGMLVGHGDLRRTVMGPVGRAPDEGEMRRMEEILDRELERGAFGLSFGLIYPPSAFAETEELTRLARVAAGRDGLISVHMRNEGPRLFEAVNEMLGVARDSGVRLEISHLKLMGRPQWGRAPELLALIEQAQAQGVNVHADQYPYCASHTSLRALTPHWAQDGGVPALKKRVAAPTPELRRGVTENLNDRGGADAVLISRATGHPEYNDRTLAQIAQSLGLDPTETVFRLLRETGCRVQCIYFCMDRNDMLAVMSRPWVSVGTDSPASGFDPEIVSYSPHPRVYGTFPCFFRTVREERLMSVGQAVRKCTSLPASVMGLSDRGILAPGLAADITVFDPAAVSERGDYTESRVAPAGIEAVVVNGQIALEREKTAVTDAGRALLKG